MRERERNREKKRERIIGFDWGCDFRVGINDKVKCGRMRFSGGGYWGEN